MTVAHEHRGPFTHEHHRKLIRHELGHALTGMLSGVDVKRVWAPPLPTGFFDHPQDWDEVAGCVLSRGGDRRAKALMVLGGLLAEGQPAPAWPVRPTRDKRSDESQLAKIFRDEDELTYLECVRDAHAIVESEQFTRMNMLASELIAGPPYQLNERQLDDIKRTEDIMQKSHEEEDDEARALERRLIAEGILPARAERYQQADPVLTGLGENGDHASEVKAHHSRIRTEARADMLTLFEVSDKQAAKPERKTAARIQIASFEC